MIKKFRIEITDFLYNIINNISEFKIDESSIDFILQDKIFWWNKEQQFFLKTEKSKILYS